MSNNADTRTAFLAELTALSRKHGIIIAGCGCCQSPFLMDFREDYSGPPPVDGHYVYNGDGREPEIKWVNENNNDAKHPTTE